MTKFSWRLWTVFFLALLAFAGGPVFANEASPAEGPWIGPDGKPLPFANGDEAVAFLRDAEIVARNELSTGINRPLKLTLEKDGIKAHAVFRTVEVKKARFVTNNNVYIDFEDNHIFECAAYELSRMLEMNNVPPCAPRNYRARQGTVQLWIEGAMTEEKRRREGLEAPSAVVWARQQQVMRVFDALIRNFDRNQGNILIDEDWKVWLIDHTRSFHRSVKIDRMDKIVWCEKNLWKTLKALDPDEVRERLDPFLEKNHIKIMMKRRDKLVAHIEERIQAYGEDAVIFDGSKAPSQSVDLSDIHDLETARSSDDLPQKSKFDNNG